MIQTVVGWSRKSLGRQFSTAFPFWQQKRLGTHMDTPILSGSISKGSIAVSRCVQKPQTFMAPGAHGCTAAPNDQPFSGNSLRAPRPILGSPSATAPPDVRLQRIWDEPNWLYGPCMSMFTSPERSTCIFQSFEHCTMLHGSADAARIPNQYNHQQLNEVPWGKNIGTRMYKEYMYSRCLIISNLHFENHYTVAST